MKYLLAIALFLCGSISARTQHCGFDGLFIMLVSVQDAKGTPLSQAEVVLVAKDSMPMSQIPKHHRYDVICNYPNEEQFATFHYIEPDTCKRALPLQGVYALFYYPTIFPLHLNANPLIRIRYKGITLYKTMNIEHILTLCVGSVFWRDARRREAATLRVVFP